MTLDLDTASQFPYDDASTGDDPEILKGPYYIYVIRLSNLDVLPTYKIQKHSFMKHLDECQEVTCLAIPHHNILGAIKIRRFRSGTGPYCTVSYTIVDFIHNPIALNQQDDLINEIKKHAKGVLEPNTLRAYKAPFQPGISDQPDDALSNAIKAIINNIKINGKLEGSIGPPQIKKKDFI